MKKILLAFVLLLLSNIASAETYFPIVYDSSGYLLDNVINTPSNKLTLMQNYMHSYDRVSNKRLGVLTKTPAFDVWDSTLPVSSYGFDIYTFEWQKSQLTTNSVDIIENVKTTTPGSRLCRYNLDTGVMSTLTDVSGSNISTSYYHTPMAQDEDTWRKNCTLYIGGLGNNLLKYFHEKYTTTTNKVANIQDINTTSSITGTITWTNATAEVSGSGTSFTSQLTKGKWIQVHSSGAWYEIDNSNSDTHAWLRSNFTEATTSDSSGRVSNDLTTDPYTGSGSFSPIHLKFWNQRLWFATKNNSNLYCTGLQSETVPAGYEDFTSSTSLNSPASIPVEGYGIITGIETIGNYLLAFKDTSYTVYRYSASASPPIEPVKTFRYGCASPRTIQQVDDGIVYFTGKQIRYTDGFNDTSISDDIDSEFRDSYSTVQPATFWYYAYVYPTAQTYRTKYPTAFYDTEKKLYFISFPATPSSSSRMYIYDFQKKVWSGQINGLNTSASTIYLDSTQYITPRILMKLNVADTNTYVLNYFKTNTTAGIVESADLSFGDTKRQKMINWIEFWIHTPATSSGTGEVDFSFNYYADGTLNGTTQTKAILTASTDGVNKLTKVRFPVNCLCTYFRWKFSDYNYVGTYAGNGNVSIIGGNICYDLVNTQN